MTRRAFVATLAACITMRPSSTPAAVGASAGARIGALVGSFREGAEGWILRGQLTEAGDLGYYGIGNNLSLMLDPDSSLLATTRPLEGSEVVLSLRRA